MKEIITYIQESFYKTLRSEDVKTIKELPEIISNWSNIREIKKELHVWSMYKTKIYKRLIGLFERIEHFRVSYDSVFTASLDVAGLKTDTVTQKFTFTRDGNKFTKHVEHKYKKYPEHDSEYNNEYTSLEDFLAHFVMYIGNVGPGRGDTLKKSVKFELL